MKKIIILSDIWGRERSSWMEYYTCILGQYFDIQYFDCQELGEISISKKDQEDIHLEFINSGIERAVKKLGELEKDAFAILGFSIGGSIAWKACLSGLEIKYLFAISSTRLRYETKKPLGQIQVFFGKEDKFKPSNQWLEQMQVKNTIYINKGHELYQERDIVLGLCKQMLDSMGITIDSD